MSESQVTPASAALVDEGVELASVDAAQAVSAPAVTAGSLLREAREASGLHIAALAVSLKVPVKKLEALEADRLDLLPDAVFVRALASSVARSLKIDPASVLERLPGSGAPRLIRDQEGINTPFRTASDGPGPGWREQLNRPVMLMVLALLLGAVVLLFLPDFKAAQSVAHEESTAISMAQREDVISHTDTSALSSATVVPSIVAVSAPLAPSVAPATTTAVLQTPNSVMAASSTLVVAPIAVAIAVPVGVASVSGKIGSVTVAGVGDGVVVFRTRDTSWVEVTDAKGVVVLRKTMAAGESAGANGVKPLTVVVGRADVTEVSVRGKAFSLGGVSKDNVARFEVK